MTNSAKLHPITDWLRQLAEAIDAGEVDAADVAQAIFQDAGYNVSCPLSEAANEGSTHAQQLLERWPQLSRSPGQVGPPDNLLRLGRGKAQRYILATLHNTSGFVALTDIARGFRGHFSGLMSAATALTKRGVLTERCCGGGMQYGLSCAARQLSRE